MVKKCISQEMLKGIACGAMLLDHIGKAFGPWKWMNAVGRMAFPIYCFLLCEGAARTRSPGRYGARLLLCALLAELPFDFLFYGGLDWAHCSTMVTLCLGFPVAQSIQKSQDKRWWIATIVMAAFLAEAVGSDYGGIGILQIAIFALPVDAIVRSVAMLVLWAATEEPLQMFAILSLVPIGLYSGRKLISSRLLQWLFYLFYPAHMAVLFLLTK